MIVVHSLECQDQSFEAELTPSAEVLLTTPTALNPQGIPRAVYLVVTVTPSTPSMQWKTVTINTSMLDHPPPPPPPNIIKCLFLCLSVCLSSFVPGQLLQAAWWRSPLDWLLSASSHQRDTWYKNRVVTIATSVCCHQPANHFSANLLRGHPLTLTHPGVLNEVPQSNPQRWNKQKHPIEQVDQIQWEQVLWKK